MTLLGSYLEVQELWNLQWLAGIAVYHGVGGVFIFSPTSSALFVLRKHCSTLLYLYERVKALRDWTDFALRDWTDFTYMTLNDIDAAVESFKKLEPNDG
ncbi:peptidyl-prolyl cis-trans isomerase CYP40-like [Pyrus ussuriensis x Pyrus communis]|uniref:Peptidyl-prolyl cis-trans isomerase CYP40-like n=1 Tax=Pyrus ussuriensis x Pyrus communis TaxID=2448454 RepID=A0A5N5HYP9_9ROSA|nr:peptidyl-prolyl cis-trans isomerase CYP40-like [Pyrus ussuriensis x Pyrus communis]